LPQGDKRNQRRLAACASLEIPLLDNRLNDTVARRNNQPRLSTTVKPSRLLMAFQAIADWAGQYGACFTPHFRQIKNNLRRIDPAHCAVMRLGHI
jgi:hypothetical protein